MNTIVKGMRAVGSLGANVVFPALGIPRPWSYLATGFWLVWIGSLGYMIVTR